MCLSWYKETMVLGAHVLDCLDVLKKKEMVIACLACLLHTAACESRSCQLGIPCATYSMLCGTLVFGTWSPEECYSHLPCSDFTTLTLSPS